MTCLAAILAAGLAVAILGFSTADLPYVLCAGLLWPFAPLHRREVIAAGGSTLSDTMHLVLAGVTVLLMFAAIGFGAAAFGSRFRIYSFVTIAILLGCGGVTFLEAPALAANLPTPWLGVWERINIGVFLVWVAVLAMLLLRTHGADR